MLDDDIGEIQPSQTCVHDYLNTSGETIIWHHIQCLAIRIKTSISRFHWLSVQRCNSPPKKNPRHSKWHWQEIIRYIKSLSLIKNYDTIVGHHLATYMLQIKLPWGPVSLINLSPGMGYFIVHLHLGSQGFFTLSHGGTPVQSSHNLWLWVVTPDRCAGYPYLFAIDAVAPRMKLSNVVVLQVLL